MTTQQSPALTVYFDGLCLLCSKEINHYKKEPGANQIRFVDIAAPDFNAQAEQVDPYLVHKVMHVKDSAGTLITKANAFLAIWKVLPRYQKFAVIGEKKIPKLFLDLGYELFFRVRPYLPKAKQSCETSPYCDIAK